MPTKNGTDEPDLRSATKKLKKYLETYGSISSTEIVDRFNLMQPARRIYSLREDYGLDIRTRLVDRKRKDSGKPYKLAIYWLGPPPPGAEGIDLPRRSR